MSPTANAIADRIYAAVKQMVLDGAFRPGERIEAARLGDRLGSSATPVRAALHRLVGERLVEGRSSEGFHCPPITEVGLKDLYDWNGRILGVAAQLAWPAPARSAAEASQAPDPETGKGAAALFSALARRTGSLACLLSVKALNDQLHAARRLEPQVLEGMDPELTELAGLLHAPDASGFRQALALYHRRRLRAAPQLVSLLHRLTP
jgi:hypothetical protein